jgi:hypothetical protein
MIYIPNFINFSRHTDSMVISKAYIYSFKIRNLGCKRDCSRVAQNKEQ